MLTLVLAESISLSTYLLFGLLGDDPEPVSNHTENCSEVGKTHQDPEPHDGLIIVQILNLRAS